MRSANSTGSGGLDASEGLTIVSLTVAPTGIKVLRAGSLLPCPARSVVGHRRFRWGDCRCIDRCSPDAWHATV
ncbi:hypothetical protein FRAAL3209 [Frankia alni ACN14a]|uniref:Uncharacterized protein n=1 Tax=Frankia alni (strain DSM 45986 / CECT 9034 / ACN14a) TaxID=326424 RepID=Q0RKV2_FRAAA|nr:hypothetical protein FRAAL3209 [Frankia alni ACN14a]